MSLSVTSGKDCHRAACATHGNLSTQVAISGTPATDPPNSLRDSRTNEISLPHLVTCEQIGATALTR
jgi:hypothetical protein